MILDNQSLHCLLTFLTNYIQYLDIFDSVEKDYEPPKNIYTYKEISIEMEIKPEEKTPEARPKPKWPVRKFLKTIYDPQTSEEQKEELRKSLLEHRPEILIDIALYNGMERELAKRF